MASQVLSGSSNVSYTNNTGQNVRIVINYMAGSTAAGAGPQISMSWAGVSINNIVRAIGRNLAITLSGAGSINALPGQSGINLVASSFPTEIMIASGQTFSATCGEYNIVVIPEAG